MKKGIAIIVFGITIASFLSGCYIYTREPLPPPAIIIMPEGGPPPTAAPPPPPPPSGAVGPVRRY
jgi:hypothetical protein